MRTLPPWEANEYFKSPSETTFVVSLGVQTSLCLADPQRVGLIFGVPAINTQGLSITTRQNTGPNVGFVLAAGSFPFSLTHHDFGPLVQSQWFASTQSTQSVTVLELFLNDWPQHDPDDTEDVRSYLEILAQEIKAMSAAVKRLTDSQNALSGYQSRNA